MKSYAAVDRIVDNSWVVCEVMLTELGSMPSENKTKMMDIPILEVLSSVKVISEKDVLIVEHDCEQITAVYQKDDEEKQRRLERLRQLKAK